MARKKRWVAVDLNGNEFMYLKYPPRRSEGLYCHWRVGMSPKGKVITQVTRNASGFYARKIVTRDSGGLMVLAKGTIRKLIGRDLTWNDEPVELKGVRV